MKMGKILGAAAAVGMLAAGGTAFTASNSLPAASVTKGYGSQSITGVTATSVTYNTNTAADTVTSVGLVLTGDTTLKTIQIAFNDDAPATCSDAGTYASIADQTTYSCVVSQTVGGTTKFALVAS
ncbi:MAG: hypothetical protein JWO37_178 [Acidimicrobiales bacterium]|jgi:hypothetical protein|nr:hypothetical protein [Acidimicrobiales bacterium]